MRHTFFWSLITVFAIYFIAAAWLFRDDLPTADFLIRFGLSFGTLVAVLSALFGDYLRETLDPIRVIIEVPKESNVVIDKCIFNNAAADCYRHHLVVRNLTPHKAIKDCRVWLKKIRVQQVNNDWKDDPIFAVPRLMEWAPSEYSPDKRTFSRKQVFDLGTTIEKSGGFEASYNRAQGGNVPRHFLVGKKLRFIFVVTGDNYLEEKEFCFEIEVLPTIQGQTVTPSKVTPVPKFA
jgi:hypothetical protein